MKSLVKFVTLALMGGAMAFAQLPNPLNLPDPLGIAQHDGGRGGRGRMHHGGRWHGRRHYRHHRRW